MVLSLRDRQQEILCQDLDPAFVESLAILAVWEYYDLFERIAAIPGLSDQYRSELFSRHRADRIVSALVRAALKHGIPYGFRRLECNGQRKLLVKASRVILIQEPMSALTDGPHGSDFKRELAEAGSAVQQLELDLGDQPNRVLDWSGCVLAVVQHGVGGPAFTLDDKMLGGLFIAVPDASYQMWVIRLDIHRFGMWGLKHENANIDANAAVQEDKVIVTPKQGTIWKHR